MRQNPIAVIGPFLKAEKLVEFPSLLAESSEQPPRLGAGYLWNWKTGKINIAVSVFTWFDLCTSTQLYVESHG